MTSETKRHIDAARQVLVGVVPNPTSQIDQITNALIYKFMDDMDQAAIKQGDEPSFFVGNLERYAWTRLMDPSMGNQERMNLYSEALIKFSESKDLPELFRGIFKSAFLPYRSPETLGLFLKEIDFFDYSHPEELGNAYEYLLSIMSSQGDAGQFRTPRHIIDFIVDVVNPTENDKVLDPACGTGGFLVSSYTHILEQHDGKDDPQKKEKPLTPDQRRNLMNNFEGYDIDPTMVRIAQVNMYLHQFKNPKILQYDSLSSDERWNDKFDVILANPPFMSPKGGIKPHSKFSVQSSRSEVLFVDYIMNHLRPKGRAGIIVPEGIIFQSGSAYKDLRKKLVEDGLFAVVSLPSGVFNPYSGVKTSVLLFDAELGRQQKEIMFVKIENDGFDLGAQRREKVGSDLPAAARILLAWRNGKKIKNNLVQWVSRKIIAENGDYNLSGDRYRVVTDYSRAKWTMVTLGELEKKEKVKFLRGQGLSKSDLSEEGKNKCIHYGEIYTLYDPIIKYVISRTDFDGKIKSIKGDVLIPATTTADAMGIAVARSLNENGVIIGGDINIIRTENKYILSDYLANLISNPPLKIELSKSAKGANILHLSNSDLKRLQIPLPPLEIQEQIVAELDGYADIIAGAKQIVQNWKPKIDIDPKWEKVKLEDVCEKLFAGGDVPKDNYSLEKNERHQIPIYTNGINEKSLYGFTDQPRVDRDSVTISARGTIGYSEVRKAPFYPAVRLIVATPNLKKIDMLFLKYSLDGLDMYRNGNSIPQLTIPMISSEKIHLPPLETQKQIVEKIEAEHTLVVGNKKLIEIYEQKTKDVIDKLWKE